MQDLENKTQANKQTKNKKLTQKTKKKIEQTNEKQEKSNTKQTGSTMKLYNSYSFWRWSKEQS